MNPMTMVVGLTAIGYGVYAASARKAKPDQFRKLGPMQSAFGERTGVVLHTVSYAVVPILFGIAMVAHGFRGGSLF